MSTCLTRSCLLLSMLCLASPAFAQVDQRLPPIGGEGGGQYNARCAIDEILNGFELRTGDDVDAIRPICAVAHSPTVIGPRNAYPGSFGGTGGGVVRVVCPDNTPAIAGLLVGWEGVDTFIVNNVRLYCSTAATHQLPGPYPTVAYDGPEVKVTGKFAMALRFEMQSCPDGLIPVGIHGRSGIWLDSVGLICGALRLDAPRFTTPPVKSIGRTASPSTPRPARTICEAAYDSRARNSPAAPNLEAQCRAAGGKPVPPAPPAPPAPAPAAITTADLEGVMARGAALASADPLAAELRRRTPAGAVRRGFDIGMGIWAGNTAPGPGKQRFHDALSPIEQPGFDIAAAFALPRNKHAVFANVGAAIANADPVVARARAAENDVFYWLGFDIASGIFGDPARGAQGNTAVGPGSLGIRDELIAPAQRGFNAATALHLSSRYR